MGFSPVRLNVGEPANTDVTESFKCRCHSILQIQMSQHPLGPGWKHRKAAIEIADMQRAEVVTPVCASTQGWWSMVRIRVGIRVRRGSVSGSGEGQCVSCCEGARPPVYPGARRREDLGRKL